MKENKKGQNIKNRAIYTNRNVLYIPLAKLEIVNIVPIFLFLPVRMQVILWWKFVLSQSKAQAPQWAKLVNVDYFKRIEVAFLWFSNPETILDELYIL